MRIPLRIGATVVLTLFLSCSVLADDAGAILPVAKRIIYPGDIITEDMISLSLIHI